MAGQSVKETNEIMEQIDRDQYQIKPLSIQDQLCVSHPNCTNQDKQVDLDVLKSRITIACPKSDCSLFSNIFSSASQQYVIWEISGLMQISICWSAQKICRCTQAIRHDVPGVGAVIAEVAAVVNTLEPDTTKTFAAYAQDVFHIVNPSYSALQKD